MAKSSACHLHHRRHLIVRLPEMPLMDRHQHLLTQRRLKSMRRPDLMMVINRCWMRTCMRTHHVEKNHIHVNMFRWFGRAMEKIKGRDWMSD